MPRLIKVFRAGEEAVACQNQFGDLWLLFLYNSSISSEFLTKKMKYLKNVQNIQFKGPVYSCIHFIVHNLIYLIVFLGFKYF